MEKGNREGKEIMPASTTSSSSSNNGRSNHQQKKQTPAPLSQQQQPPTPTTPRSLPRSDSAAATAALFPTTFVQADAASFKQVVQMLTGSSETAVKQQQQQPGQLRSDTAASSGRNNPTGPKRPAFKLYERRHHSSFKSLKIVNPLVPGLFNFSPSGSGSGPDSPSVFSPSATEIPSPSVVLDFPSLTLSPVTPEERAIAEKGFYLHPSPRSSDAPPRLLPLFPVTSPRAGESTPI